MVCVIERPSGGLWQLWGSGSVADQKALGDTESSQVFSHQAAYRTSGPGDGDVFFRAPHYSLPQGR